MKKVFMLCALFLMTGCGVLNDMTDPMGLWGSGGGSSQFHPADASVATGRYAIVAATSWIDPVGSLASIDTESNYAADLSLITTDGSDVVLRTFNGRVYVINRFGTDTIQVIDPDSFGIDADYSVGAGSNPQDIWAVSDSKAYVSRLDAQNDVSNDDDILIVNPLTGGLLGSIDLKIYALDDGDRLARAAQMVAVGNKLFVCLQDLPSNLLESANTNGKVVVINMENDQVITSIELSGRNPADITYSPLTRLIYVSESGVFNNFMTDVTDPYGGIEVIDPETLQSHGIMIDDSSFGGYTKELRLVSQDLGFVIVGGNKVASFNPATYEMLNDSFYVSKGFYIPDISVDRNNNLYVAEMDAENPGVVILSSNDGSVVAGPIPVGAPPSGITFVNIDN
jgi:DNA-binding beta-propeller fold protein YncE